ncbi:MAG: SRPBCC family protein [Bacteriovoracaceae bacterium]|nr:SRPBCC family protein [Bacteriovoracaceae bacterium]
MAEASKTEVFDVDMEKIFKVLSDLESYPDFMTGVERVEVIERSGDEVKARYDLNLIKKFSYTLNHKLEAPNRISWTLDSGDLLSKSDGSWDLKDVGNGKTEVTYSINVDFKVKVPGLISKKLVSSNLPSMMKAVKEKAKKA